MREINNHFEDEIKIIINEFIISCEITSKEKIPIEFLKFLRNKEIQIENAELFNKICDMVESKYF